MFHREDLRADQVEAVDWLKHRTEALLLLPVGFGKTIITLTALNDMMDAYDADWRVLVLSTRNIVEHTWGQELLQWEHLSRFKEYLSAAGRKKGAVFAKPQVLGVNFENIEWFFDLVDADPSLCPDVLVIDESSKMKSHAANRVKRLIGGPTPSKKRNPGYVRHFVRRFALSATPNPEGYQGLWSQEACIAPRRRLGVNITQFRDRYSSPVWNGVRMEFKITGEAMKAIDECLSPITFAPRRDSYLDLPDPVHSVVKVGWSDESREEYDALEGQFLLDLRERIETVGAEKGLDIHTPEELEAAGLSHAVAPNMAVLLNKLRQSCSGFVYDADGNARKLADADAKLDALDEIIDRVGDVPVVVFTQFTAEAAHIKDRHPDAQVGLPKDLSDWNAGRIPILILHPRSAGHGVNLQHGSHVAIWYSLPWSYEEWHQANGRLHRTGQTKQVSIVRIEREDSVERDVWLKLQGKEARLSAFVNSMRERRHA